MLRWAARQFNASAKALNLIFCFPQTSDESLNSEIKLGWDTFVLI